MDDKQIEQLEAVLDDANNGKLYWMPDENTARRVMNIGNPPTPKAGDIEEPSKVAYFANGEYAALYNADFNEFVLVRPVSDVDVFE